jgi:hypothetical protein
MPARVSRKAVWRALHRLGVRGSVRSDGSPVLTRRMREKRNLEAHRARLIALAALHADYALGFQDEVWWSRAQWAPGQPHLHAWTDQDEGLRLVEQTTAKDDPAPKVLTCYGVLLSCLAEPETLLQQLWLRFVEHRPLSSVTTQYLAGCWEKLEMVGNRGSQRPATALLSGLLHDRLLHQW